uniref:Aldehyde dehydrogenase n=1 Tax=Rhabditophanes sp. KR3021 TaxID=114890 RepID=A0AC35UFN3_9BILA
MGDVSKFTTIPEEMDYQEILSTQRAYFDSGEPQKLSNRKAALKVLKSILLKDDAALTDGVEKDLRRGAKSTWALEIASAIGEIDYFLANLDSWAADEPVKRTHMTALDSCFLKKQPKGVVLLIAPWNYPVSMVLLPLIPAIAAGNTVIIKPSELAPATSQAFDTLFSKAFDKKLVKVVQGGIPETTALLKLEFDHIFYTGCPPVAKIIMKAAAEYLTPVTLELGGKCPVYVDKDADIEITARRIAWGKWMNCGQTCLSPDYILTTEAIKPKLIEEMKKAILEFYGPDISTSKDYSRIINNRHWNRINNLLIKSKGEVLYQSGKPNEEDLFIPPTIIDSGFHDSTMSEEIFGPVLPIITVTNLGEAIEFIKKGERPLASYIFSRSESSVERFVREVISGGCTVNDVIMHITVDTLPFGGIGNSGMGRYRGKFGFDTFTHEKAVLKKGFFLESLLAIRYPPMTESKFKQLSTLQKMRWSIPSRIPWGSMFGIVGIFVLGFATAVLALKVGQHHQ